MADGTAPTAVPSSSASSGSSSAPRARISRNMDHSSDVTDISEVHRAAVVDLLHSSLRKLNRYDEADQLLEMGFRPDIERILAFLPKRRQTLLFSATFKPSVEQLLKRRPLLRTGQIALAVSSRLPHIDVQRRNVEITDDHGRLPVVQAVHLHPGPEQLKPRQLDLMVSGADLAAVRCVHRVDPQTGDVCGDGPSLVERGRSSGNAKRHPVKTDSGQQRNPAVTTRTGNR